MSEPIAYGDEEKKAGVSDPADILDSSSEDVSFTALVAEGEIFALSMLAPELITNVVLLVDHKHDIKLRTMSWQKAAWLLAGDQVCLAIMAQTWSLS